MTSVEQENENSKKNLPGEKTRIIAFTSGKGGVGKTVLTVNIAIGLAKKGYKVLVFDGDLGLGNVNVLLGIHPKFNISHVAKGHKTLPEVILQTTEGIDIIPGANGSSLLANLSDESRNALFKSLEEVTGYDYILIDTGAGLGGKVMSCLQVATEICLVTVYEPSAITDVFGLIRSISVFSRPKKLRMVTNRIKKEKDAQKAYRKVNETCSKFLNISPENLGFIYYDEMIEKSIRQQKPFMAYNSRGKAAENLTQILNLLEDNNKKVDIKDSGRQSYISRLFSFIKPKNA